MNFARNAILTAIIFQMTHATFPLRYNEAHAADNRASSEQTTLPSTNAFVDAVIEQGKDLTKNGCVDKNGEVTRKYITDQDEIQKEDGKGINCFQAVTNYMKGRAHALEIIKEEESKRNENCADCTAPSNVESLLKGGIDAQSWVQKQLGDGKSCSEAEKAAIQKENKSCNYTCGLKNAAAASLNSPVGIALTLPMHLMFGNLKIDKSPNCPIPQGNSMNCLWDIVKTLALSLGDMALGIWNGLAGLANLGAKWVGGLFSAHKDLEDNATKKMMAVSGMTDADVKTAKVDKGKSFMEKIKSGMGTLIDFFTNYKELGTEFDCVHCKDKLNPVCKVIGLVGRDLIVMWLTGKAFKAMGPIVKRLANKTKVSRFIYRKSVVAIGRLSNKTAAKWAAFKSETIKFGKNTFKKVGELPGKISVVRKETTSKMIRKVALQDETIRKAVGDVEAKTAHQTIDEGVKSVDELVVGMNVPGQAEAVEQATKDILNLPNAKLKVKKGLWAERFDGIQNAEPAEFVIKEKTQTLAAKETSTTARNLKRVKNLEPVTTSEGKFAEVVDRDGLVRRFPVEPNKKVVSVETYQNAKGETNAILKHSDGSYIIHSEEGLTGGYAKGPRVSGASEPLTYDSNGAVKVPVEKAALVEEASGKTVKGRPVEEVRVEAIEENLKANDIKYTKNPDGSIDYEAPNGCGKGSINCAGVLKAL